MTSDPPADRVQISLLPLGRTLTLPRCSALQEALFELGVEFPCGGRGLCRGCRVKVLSNAPIPSPEEARLLSHQDLDSGWRLACRLRADTDLELELAQWTTTILADDTPFDFSPQEGLGVAVDVGTTTVVAQLLDLPTGRVLGVRSALNEQARRGADVMSRIEYAIRGGEAELIRLIRDQIGAMIRSLGPNGSTTRVRRIVLVGNTVMHQLFCERSVEPLSHYPFEPAHPGGAIFTAANLGWNSHELELGPRTESTPVHFLPCLGGFVGSDLLAGILATRLHEGAAPCALIDLGTNGEIVVGNCERILCASTAAGPAFEGARISMGMRADAGAIAEVDLVGATLRCHVLGHGPPRGICGSGLVDAVACALELGLVRPDGRLPDGQPLALAGPVCLVQRDIRELQLAKAAVAAGLRILVRRWGTDLDGLARVYLAGAFGNYIRHASARRIGLLQVPTDRVTAAGNTALLGAKLALFNPFLAAAPYSDLLRRVEHVSLHEDPAFNDIFAREMRFPDTLPAP